MTTTAAEPARRGRPRSVAADVAILDAALEVFAEAGYAGLTIEAVAARAGVAKSTVYRRYPGKLDLLLAASEHARPPDAGPPDTGSFAGDLLELATGLRSVLLDSDVGRTIPSAIGAAARHPDVAEAYQRRVAERRRRARAVVERGIDRGEVDASTDPDLVIDQVVGPLFYRVLISGAPVDDRTLRRLAEAAARSVRPG